MTENSTIGAVSDIITTPAHADFYTPATAALVTNLTNPIALSGAASSCVEFDPVTSTCSSLTPIALQTNRGNFYLFGPYTDDETGNGGTGPFSINWGLFWAETGGRDE